MAASHTLTLIKHNAEAFHNAFGWGKGTNILNSFRFNEPDVRLHMSMEYVNPSHCLVHVTIRCLSSAMLRGIH